MSSATPIHTLRERLRAARLQAIEHAAMDSQTSDELNIEAIQRIAELHAAILAVDDELVAHAPKLGSGSEVPLA